MKPRTKAKAAVRSKPRISSTELMASFAGAIFMAGGTKILMEAANLPTNVTYEFAAGYIGYLVTLTVLTLWKGRGGKMKMPKIDYKGNFLGACGMAAFSCASFSVAAPYFDVVPTNELQNVAGLVGFMSTLALTYSLGNRSSVSGSAS